MSGSGGNENPRGRTPITVNGCASTVTLFPSRSGEPPNRRRNAPSLRMMTWFFPRGSSSAVRLRPSAGWTPSVGRKLAVTAPSSTFCGPSGVVRLAVRV